MHKLSWVALVLMLGCGDDDSVGDGGAQTSAATACMRGCTRAAAANCPGQPSNCQQQCEASIDATPARCLVAVNAYASCVSTAVFSCDEMGVAEATGCAAQFNAWQSCAGSITVDATMAFPDASTPDSAIVIDSAVPPVNDAAVVDSAVSDTGVPDSGGALSCEPAAADPQCDLCTKKWCCDAVGQCGTDCLALIRCAGNCPPGDTLCPQTCRTTYPGGITGATAIYNCQVVYCPYDCGL